MGLLLKTTVTMKIKDKLVESTCLLSITDLWEMMLSLNTSPVAVQAVKKTILLSSLG